MSEYMSDIYVDGLRIISVKLNFEKSSVSTYLLSIDTRWRHRLGQLRKQALYVAVTQPI